jgi:hypothetical protein
MKSYLKKFGFVFLIICGLANAINATTYDWKGGQVGGLWSNPNNWSPVGNPGASDIVRIGIASFTNQPTITTSSSCASITFGGSIPTSSNQQIILTINNAASLTTGSVILSPSLLVDFSAMITGSGTLTCNSLVIGNSSIFASLLKPSSTLQFISKLAIFHITGDVIVNSTSIGLIIGLGSVNGNFSLQDGTVIIDGLIKTLNTTNLIAPPASPTFTIDMPLGSSFSPTLQLLNPNAIDPTSNISGSIDFFNNTGGTGIATVNYSGNNQTIYTNTTTLLRSDPQTYQNLILSGTGIKTINSGSLTIGNDFTSTAPTVLFNTNNATAAIGRDWTNSSSITQGTGDITVARSLTNNTGGVLGLSGANLLIGGNYTNNIGGVYTQSTGTTNFNGTGTQNLVDNSTTGTLFNKVNFSGGGTATMALGTNNVNFSLANTGILTMSNNSKLVAGAITVGGASYLTLISDASSSASVATITGSSTITGNVNVQRYFKAQATGATADNTRNYRLLSSPVNNGSGGYNLNYLNNNPGVFVSGPTGTAGGFTVTNATPTIYLNNESLTASTSSFSGGNFKGLTNITAGNLTYYNSSGTTTSTLSNLPVGNGFFLYYIGDNIHNVTSTTALNKQFRFNGFYIAPDAATITATGNLNQGTIPVTLWWNSSTTLSNAKTGYNLVGNPYASTIDWDKFSNTISTAGIFAPNVSSSIYVYNYSSRNYGIYPAGTAGGTGTNNASRYIASGQGFFVKATATTGATITFNEAAKTTAQPNTFGTPFLLMGIPKAIAQTQLLHVKLAKDSVNTDDIMLLFDTDSKNEYEPYNDANRLEGIGNIATLASYSSKNNTMLAINHMTSIDSNTRIKLYVNISKSTAIDTLSASGFESLDQRYNVYLIDHFKRDSLLFSNNHKYLFNIDNTDTTSFGANRFEIIFHKKPTLVYKLLSFTATPVKTGIQLTWKTENESNLTGFIIERQDGSKEFVGLNSMVSNSGGTYSYIDKSPFTGINYYRIKQNDPFDQISYSNIISIKTNINNSVNQLFTLYPNPVTTQLNVKINKDIPNAITLRITNLIGNQVVNKDVDSDNIQQNVSSFLPGSYIIEIIDRNTKKSIGIKKFIKQ